MKSKTGHKSEKRQAIDRHMMKTNTSNNKSLQRSFKQTLPSKEIKTDLTSPLHTKISRDGISIKKVQNDVDRSYMGNFNAIREMIREGAGGDYRWMLGLRSPARPFSSYKKYLSTYYQNSNSDPAFSFQ